MSCPNIVIRNSQEHSFDPIHGIEKDEEDIFCNDGYVFNHDLLHQGGQIECKKKKGDKDPQWYIKDARLDELCEKHTATSSPSCESVTYKPYDLLDISEKEKKEIFGEEQFEFINRDIHVGCALEGEKCVFKKNVKEVSKHEKLCEPLYCPAKSIPHSNKDGLDNNDMLPGPIKDVTNKGECIDHGLNENFKPIIIDYIKSPEDCLCHRHQSCSMCAGDSNCSWCGDKNSTDPTQAGCFSIHSKEPKCQDTTTNLQGRSSCINKLNSKEIYPEWYTLNWSAQTEQKCTENKSCFLYGDNDTVINIPSKSPIADNVGLLDSNDMKEISMDHIILQNMHENPDFEKLESVTGLRTTLDEFTRYKETWEGRDEELCNSFNNKYKNNEKNDHIVTEGCYYQNILVSKQSYQKESPNFGLKGNTDNTDTNISIEPYYCAPSTSNHDSCWGNPYQSCATPSCKWTKNHLDNNIIKFSGDKDGNIMELSCDKCKLEDNQFTYDEEGTPKKWYVKSNKDDEKYITISDPSDSSKKPYSFDTTTWSDAKYKIKYYSTFNSLTNNNTLAPNNISNLTTEYCGDECKDTGEFIYYDIKCGTPDNLKKISEEPERSYKRKSRKSSFNQIDCNSNNKTNFMYTDTGGYVYPTTNIMNKSYGICSHSKNIELSELECSNINNTYSIDKKYNTSNYSYLCSKGDDKISAKELCEITDGYTWMYKTDDGKWDCFNTTTETEPLPTDICGLYDYNTDDNKIFKCLIEVPTTEMNSSEPSQYCTKYYDIRWKGPTGGTNWESDIQFNIETNFKEVCPNDGDYVEGCIKGKGYPDSKSKVNLYSKNECENTWYTKYENIYKHNDRDHCPNEDTNAIDRNLKWYGGDIYKDDKGNWGTTCSSSILSSCQVVCDDKWGGGGEFVCNYNNDGEEICSKIDMISDPSSKENNCRQYPLCEYNKTEKSCKYVDPDPSDKFLNKGQTEWIGPECYLLNNDSFAQGVYNYPSLNSKFPPLARLITLFLIIILFSYILYKLDVFKKLLGIFKGIIVGDQLSIGIPESFVNTASIYYKSFKYSVKNYNTKKTVIYIVSIILIAMFIPVMGRIYDVIKLTLSNIDDIFRNIKF